MTLLSSCQDVARSIGLVVPSTIVTNTSDETAVRLLAAAKKEGKALAKHGLGWTILQKEYTFTTSASVASYSMPSDFERFINQTQWDRANNWELRGPMTPQGWQRIKSGIVTTGPRRRFRIKASSQAKLLFIDPTPSEAGDTIAFEYLSNQWCQSSSGSAQSDWAADDDVIILDEHVFELGLEWRVRRAFGFPYAEEMLEYKKQLDKVYAADGGAQAVYLDAENDPIIGDVNMPEAGFG